MCLKQKTAFMDPSEHTCAGFCGEETPKQSSVKSFSLLLLLLQSQSILLCCSTCFFILFAVTNWVTHTLVTNTPARGTGVCTPTVRKSTKHRPSHVLSHHPSDLWVQVHVLQVQEEPQTDRLTCHLSDEGKFELN